MLWFFIAGLSIVAVCYLVLPLFRTADEIVDDRKEQNIRIVREQLTELEGSFERGEVESEQYSQRRDELEQTLLVDVSGLDELVARPKTSSSSWVSAGFLALFVPISAVALYLYLGTPNAQQLAVDTAKPEVPLTADGKPDIDKLVTSLHDKLRKNPDNEQGWYMLGRSYMMMKRYDGAIEAYENLYRLQSEEPDVMLMLADALSMKQQGKMVGRPEILINEALAKAPQNTTALWLSGMALEQQEKYQAALDRWQILRPLLKDDLQEQVQLDVLIKRVKASLSGDNASDVVSGDATKTAGVKALVASSENDKSVVVGSKGDTPTKAVASNDGSFAKAKSVTETEKPATASAAKVILSVSLSDEFMAKVSPDDSVFIYAKAQTGPPMPLAASRLQVKDLPVTVTLDDTMAMMPQMKLSMFDTVIVGARVSKSGNAVGQDGDLFVEQEQVSQGDEVALVINEILKK